ncbi:MAG: ATP phosphoribosyltransferase [Thermodesulfobacteriota bacterium]|nr:ATP phosphoribosyltransferase [Thermodesulfobacteriota bacterium]
MDLNQILKLGIPKGSLEKATIDLFQKAGWRITVGQRSYFPDIDDKEVSCTLLRAQEMSRHVEGGLIDLGITGHDWIMEYNSDVTVVQDLIYSKSSLKQAKWVLVVKENSPIKKIEDLEGKKISTELVNFTKNYFKDRNINVQIEFSWGATEAKVAEGLVDAIVEVTETGSTIKANNLKIIDELLTTNPQLIANKEAWSDSWKKEKIEQISLLVSGALYAESMVGLKMNVPKDKLENIMELLPSITSPTISDLYGKHYVSVETIAAKNIVRDLIPLFKKRGAEGIVEYPLNKVV